MNSRTPGTPGEAVPAGTGATKPGSEAPAPTRAPQQPAPGDSLRDDVRSSLLLMAATALFAMTVIALGTAAAGVPS